MKRNPSSQRRTGGRSGGEANEKCRMKNEERREEGTRDPERGTSSRQNDDAVATREGLLDASPCGCEAGEQSVGAAVSQAHPQKGTGITGAVGEVEEVLVLRHYNAAFRGGV